MVLVIFDLLLIAVTRYFVTVLRVFPSFSCFCFVLLFRTCHIAPRRVASRCVCSCSHTSCLCRCFRSVLTSCDAHALCTCTSCDLTGEKGDKGERGERGDRGRRLRHRDKRERDKIHSTTLLRGTVPCHESTMTYMVRDRSADAGCRMLHMAVGQHVTSI